MPSERFDEDALSVEDLEEIDQACLHFEKAFRAGHSPRIESYLGKVRSELQRAALFYLIRLETDLLREEGGDVSLQQYQDRFPQQRELVDLAWDGEADFEVALEVIIGPHRGRRFAFTQHDSFVVGRAGCAHFRLPVKDPFFSRVHFLVEVNPPQCRLVDLCSLNGTKVNGNQVDWADLRHGDLIQGGDTVIRVSIRMPEDYTQPAIELTGGSRQHGKDPLAKQEPSLPETQAWGQLPEIPGYKMVTPLGRGGMGVVYLASRAADGAHVAVKIIRPACAPSDQEVQRFLREAQILCALRHPNVVSFHQLGRLGQIFYIVMDFVAGSDTRQLVQRHGPLPTSPPAGTWSTHPASRPCSTRWWRRCRSTTSWSSHTLKTPKATKYGKTATVRICVSCGNFGGKWGRHGRRTFVYAFWGFQPGSTRWVRETYRTRFGIETSYRQMNEARIRTCSRSPLLRLLFFGLAMILRNVRVWFHLTTLSARQGRRLILHLERLRFKDLLLDLQRVVEVVLGITQILMPQPEILQPLATP